MNRTRLRRNRAHLDSVVPTDGPTSSQPPTNPGATTRARRGVTIAGVAVLLLAIPAVVLDHLAVAIVLLLVALALGVIAWKSTAFRVPQRSTIGNGTMPTTRKDRDAHYQAAPLQPGPFTDIAERTDRFDTQTVRHPDYEQQDPDDEITSKVMPPESQQPISAYLRNQLDARQPALALTGDIIRLGRSRHSDLIIAHDTVSRSHAVLIRDRLTGLWTLQAASDALTLVSGRRHQPSDPPAVVHNADVVVFGETVWQMDYQLEATPAPGDQASRRHSQAPTINHARADSKDQLQLGHPLKDVRMPAMHSRITAVPPILVAAGETSAGTRPNNNDVFLIKGTSAAIADAVGGGDDGVTTAATIRSVLRDYLPHVHTEHQVREVFDAVDHALRRLRRTPVRTAATTLDVLAYDADTATITGGHVGDSQVFKVRRTHSKAPMAIAPVTATNPDHAALTNAVGFFADRAEQSPRVSTWTELATPGDIYVMVTDGFLEVWESINPADAIAATLSAHIDATPSTQASKLVRAALQAHQKRPSAANADNVTVVVVHIRDAT